jgi:hypothetical protein
MGRLADFYANQVMDMAFGRGTNNFPTDYYIALSSVQPTNTGGNVTEPAGNNYSRVHSLNNDANWPAARGRTKSNGQDILFPAATGDWGTMAFFAIYDDPTAGNFVAWGELTTPTDINVGAQAAFITGTLVINAPGT